MINGEPWFVGKDVASVLGYSKSRNAIAMHVDEEDKRAERIVHPLQNHREWQSSMSLVFML